MKPKKRPVTLTSQPGEQFSKNEFKITTGFAIVNFRAPSAWRVAPGVVWLQVHEARLTEALKKVTGWKLVAYGVAGGYLRIFEFHRPLAWALDWITRHTSANEAFPQPDAHQRHFVRPDRVTQGEGP